MSVIPVTLDFDTTTETAKRSAWLRSPKTVAGLVIFGAFVIMAIVGPSLAPYNPSATLTSFLSPPSLDHLLGTTAQGQDVLSQLLTGARYSMLVGIVAAGIGESLAIIVGITAGFMGGIVDEVLSTITNIFLVIPVLPLKNRAFGLSAELRLAGDYPDNFAHRVARGAWTLRSQTLSIAKRDYVAAAKVAGDSNLRIVIFEILPNETAIVVTGLLFQVLFAVIVQTGLAFLGIGSLESLELGWHLVLRPEFRRVLGPRLVVVRAARALSRAGRAQPRAPLTSGSTRSSTLSCGSSTIAARGREVDGRRLVEKTL